MVLRGVMRSSRAAAIPRKIPAAKLNNLFLHKIHNPLKITDNTALTVNISLLITFRSCDSQRIRLVGLLISLGAAVMEVSASSQTHKLRDAVCSIAPAKLFFPQVTEYKEKVYICTLVRKAGF